MEFVFQATVLLLASFGGGLLARRLGMDITPILAGVGVGVAW